MKRIIIDAILPAILHAVVGTALVILVRIIEPEKYPSLTSIPPTFLGKLYFVLQFFFVSIALGGALAGVQSIASSVVMEKMINPGVHSHFIVVILATILGSMSGIISASVVSGLAGGSNS